MKLSEPWYTYIRNKQKTVEGRLCDEKRKTFEVGDKIIFTDENGKKEFKVKITELKMFNDFESGLRYAKLKNILPGVKTYKEGVDLFNSLPNYKKRVKKDGFLLIYFR